MINIVAFNKKDEINRIEIQGHADYAFYGYDIVCASVSCIVTTTINAILCFHESIEIKDNQQILKITILNHDEITMNLINNMFNMLKKLEKQFIRNIKIEIGEDEQLWLNQN